MANSKFAAAAAADLSQSEIAIKRTIIRYRLEAELERIARRCELHADCLREVNDPTSREEREFAQKALAHWEAELRLIQAEIKLLD